MKFTTTKTDLFREYNYTSHAGLPLTWKLEMEALSTREWSNCARMIMDDQTAPFSKVVGIPRGGVPLSDALQKYVSGNPEDPIMVVDDVYTTGTSFKEYCKENYPGVEVIKWCVFARVMAKDLEHNVSALFTMPRLPKSS